MWGRGETATAEDLKSSVRKDLQVRLLPPLPSAPIQPPAKSPCYPAMRVSPHDELSWRDRLPARPDRHPLVRHSHGNGDRRRALAQSPPGPARRAAGRRHHQRRTVGDPGWPRRRAALRGGLQLGLLRPLPVEDHRRLGGRARHARRLDRGTTRRHVARAPVERADPARARYRGAPDGTRAGDRPLGELLQRGSLRPSNRPAVEALHLARTPSPRLRRSEEHTSELQSLAYLVCRLLLEKKKEIGSMQPSARTIALTTRGCSRIP